MSVLSFLRELASKAVLTAAEQSSINTSIATLQTRLGLHFSTEDLTRHFRFGSSTRDTILPRSFDMESDIDYMIVFSQARLTPQSYLTRLKTFVEKRYGTSDIYQSSPTIVLELNHIRFDLVPATQDWSGGLQIPDKAGGWMSTNPNDFNSVLEALNKQHGYMIKPTIRLVKYWNARSGFLFDTFPLEKWITTLNFWGAQNIKETSFIVFDRIVTSYEYSKNINNEIERAKEIIGKVRAFEQLDLTTSAETEIKRLFRL